MSNKIHPNRIGEDIHLPIEIFAIIIDHLGTLPALASCRLVSHAFCSLASPLFFSSLQLRECLPRWASRRDRIAAFRDRAEKLDQILTAGHGIADLVRTLTLCCHKVNLQNPLNGILISGILHRLPRIRKFTLESEEWPLQFSSITGDFIQAACRSPNITTLDLDNIRGFPITVITTCPNLRCLRLSRIEFRVNPFFLFFSH